MRSPALALLVGLMLPNAPAIAAPSRSVVIPATSFTGNWANVQVAGGSGNPRGVYVPSTHTAVLFAPFDLTIGSTIVGLAIQGCSGDTFAEVSANLYACDAQECELVAHVQPPLGDVDQCEQVVSSDPLALPVTDTVRYVVRVPLAAGLAPTEVRWVRLDIVPAPGR
jgi:hypothetical protein